MFFVSLLDKGYVTILLLSVLKYKILKLVVGPITGQLLLISVICSRKFVTR